MASSIKVFPLTFKKDEKGLCPLAFRITIGRKVRYIYLGHKIKEKDWTDKDGGQVKSSHFNHAFINALINNKRAEINRAFLQGELDDPLSSTSQAVKKSVQRKNRTVGFFEVAEQYFIDLDRAKKVNRAISERPRIKYLREFVKRTTRENELMFHDLNESILRRFITYLRGEREVCDRTVTNYLITIRTIYNRGIMEGYADRKTYPFGKGKIQIRFSESIKIGLTEAEVRKLEKVELEMHSPKWHARNVWLVSFYFAGIRISDALALKWSDLKDGRLYYRMNKNQKIVSVKVPEKADVIFMHYLDGKTSEDDYIFPELKLAIKDDAQSIFRKSHTAAQKFNKYMKMVAAQCGIQKKITTHIARHTFGNISGEKISPIMLQKLYRHSDIRTTMGYQSNFIFKEADEALDLVINF